MPKERELIWIIGASEGIGAALAKTWSKEGVRLILSARSTERLAILAKTLGEDTVVVPLDVTNRESLEAATQTIKNLGSVDRIVHLAATYDPGKVEDLDPDKAAQIVTTNLTGSFNVAQMSLRVLRKGGQLALCGSIAGYFGLPQGQIYSATKAGVMNLAQSLRAEWHDRFDVRLISPGFVDTRLTQRNDFNMPAIITPDVAAREIIRGLKSSRFELHFPRRLTLVLKTIRILPYWLSLPLTRRLTR
ncbi:Short-chain dehydrogenase/reductase SDR [Rhodobacterales bacterium HTCC2150]|nr:Short-chain dehydrogenase/reductase SDR [Rhodobacterales bacterium HTCC2150] [Rhodobacteraceae bacterium HTCC2150]